MANVTLGAVGKSEFVNDGYSPAYKVSINGYQMDGYNGSYPVLNPAGFFSRPMPGRTALFTLTPNGASGYAQGFANEIPEENNISDLQDGEAAICETSGFNFNIKAKVDKLLSTFKNDSGDIINSNIAISENIITSLIDIFAEIVLLEQAYNNFTTIMYPLHMHSGVTTGMGNSGPVFGAAPMPYVASSNFTRDKNFIATPAKMYISVNGELIS